MNILKQWKQKLLQLMQSRYGADMLGKHLLLLGIVLYVIANILSSLVLGVLALLLYLLVVLRIFSKNRIKRAEENQKYLNTIHDLRTAASQFIKRLQNSRSYKYIKCPTCKTRLRIARGQGEVRISCTQCKYKFDAKT